MVKWYIYKSDSILVAGCVLHHSPCEGEMVYVMLLKTYMSMSTCSKIKYQFKMIINQYNLSSIAIVVQRALYA